MNKFSYLSFKESKEHDKYLLKKGLNINSLIDIAGKQICNWLNTFYYNKPVLGIIGKGNNALDVLAAFNKLNSNQTIFIYCLFPDIKKSSQYKKVLKNRNVLEVNSLKNISANTIIIDGIFGTGLNRPVSETVKNVISKINDLTNTVISIDIPSGLTETDNSNCIKANITLSMMFPKKIMKNKFNRPYFGQTYVLNFHLKQNELNGYNFPKIIDNFIEVEQ